MLTKGEPRVEKRKERSLTEDRSDFCSNQTEEVWRVESMEVASDKWTGFNLRPINILVLSSPVSLPVLSVCLPFRRSPTVFRFFSRVHYLCRARGNIVPATGPVSRIFLLFYDPYKRESTEVSTIRVHVDTAM